MLNTVAITPKSEDKKCLKVFNVPEFHFSEVYFFINWYFSEIYVSVPAPVDAEEGVGSFENGKVLASFSDLEEGHPIVVEIRLK